MNRFDKLMNGWFKETVLDKALYITLVAAALIAFLGDEKVLRSVRIDVGLALIEMGATLLGIVLAGFAIFVVFLDKKYIDLLEKAFGIEADIWPFKWVAIIAIVCLLFGMVFIVLGEPSTLVFRLLVMGALWSFFYLLWEIYELVKFLAGHVKARAKQIQLDDNKNKDN